jgi:hypothetical protein
VKSWLTLLLVLCGVALGIYLLTPSKKIDVRGRLSSSDVKAIERQVPGLQWRRLQFDLARVWRVRSTSGMAFAAFKDQLNLTGRLHLTSITDVPDRTNMAWATLSGRTWIGDKVMVNYIFTNDAGRWVYLSQHINWQIGARIYMMDP